MKVVKVYGALRRRLGGRCRFEFHADTPAQAIKALCVNFPGLERWLIDREGEGLGFRVTIGREKVTNHNAGDLTLPWSERDVFSITPVIAGAGDGAGQILAGIGLIALSFFVPFASAVLFNLGTAMVITGIAQLISPQPDLGFNNGKEAARLESFTFSGIVNTSKQGLPVPIAYGRVFAGSAVISSGLDVDQLV
jgi:predicted phage tail protein